jgi:hypothetical protein
MSSLVNELVVHPAVAWFPSETNLGDGILFDNAHHRR